MSKLKYWQIAEACRVIGRKMMGDDSDYDDELFDELYEKWINYLDVGKYLEQKHNGLDLAKNGCPLCKKSTAVLEIAQLYESLPKQNKRQAYRFLQLLMDEK